jgi:hypothetical protein
MAMNHSQALKHQWQSKKPDTHRVRLYKDEIHLNEVTTMHPNQIFWHVANKFKETEVAAWVELNEIEIKWMEDDHLMSWHKALLIYADLTERQYTEYTLRFFQHMEEWK